MEGGVGRLVFFGGGGVGDLAGEINDFLKAGAGAEDAGDAHIG